MNALGAEWEKRVAQQLPDLLRSLVPLEIEWRGRASDPRADLEFHLEGEGISKTVLAQVKSGFLPGEVVARLAVFQEELRRNRPDHMLLLVVPALPESTRNRLRALGLNHADLKGTLYIREPGLLVRVDGPVEPAHKYAPMSPNGTNPFSDKASLAVRILLRTPERAWGIREIADEVGISIGLVSMVSTELIRRGYAEEQPDGVRLRDPVHLLLNWLSVVSWTKDRVLSFEVPYTAEERIEVAVPVVAKHTEGPVALTQLAGLDRFAPHVQHHDQVHLYVAPGSWDAAISIVQEELYGERAPGGGNFHLVLPHAKVSTFYDLREIDGVPVVSPVQLFLDLADFPLRGSEGAQMLLRTVLARELDLSPDQVHQIALALG